MSKLENTDSVMVAGSATDRAIMSIAISLKRIADAMTAIPKMPELSEEALANLQEELKKGGQAFIVRHHE